MKTYSGITVLCAVATVIAAASCNSERDNTLSTQEKNIESYINSNFSDCPVVRRNGVSKILVDRSILTTDSLEYGDSVKFYYAGYIFGSSGPTSIFATNSESVADKNSFVLTDPDYSAAEVLYDSGVFIEGLTEGLYGVRTGDHCVIVFSAKHGFDNTQVSVIPRMSALLYEVWIEKVTKASGE